MYYICIKLQNEPFHMKRKNNSCLKGFFTFQSKVHQSVVKKKIETNGEKDEWNKTEVLFFSFEYINFSTYSTKSTITRTNLILVHTLRK